MKGAVLLFVVFFVTPGFGQQVWEFGKDKAVGSRVLEVLKGSVRLFEYNKDVPLTVPPCHRVTYVRVEVQNHLSTPMVTYNEYTAVVTLAYKVLQHTRSEYSITVKGQRLHLCEEN